MSDRQALAQRWATVCPSHQSAPAYQELVRAGHISLPDCHECRQLTRQSIVAYALSPSMRRNPMTPNAICRRFPFWFERPRIESSHICGERTYYGAADCHKCWTFKLNQWKRAMTAA